MSTEALIDVVILTVLPEEYQAICKQLIDLQPVSGSQTSPNLYAWQAGRVPCFSQQDAYTVAVGMQGRAGTNQSALATVEAIRRWQPRYVFFVGIAGGLSSLSKGDVIIADVIYGYEYGKLEQAFLPRNNWSYHTDLGLLNGAVAYALQPNWLQRIQEIPPASHVSKVIRGHIPGLSPRRAKEIPPASHVPIVVSGEIALGDKVVDNPTHVFFAQVLKLGLRSRRQPC